MRNASVPLDFSKCSALVVDDCGTMRHLVIHLLHEAGFGRIAEAEDGIQALLQLKQRSFDIVASDWNMPNMNGLELLKAVRLSAEHKRIPFLLATAESNKNSIVAATQAGADGYILKPFNEATLTLKIEGIFVRKGLASTACQAA